MRRVVVLVMLAACGRLGFDEHTGGVTGDGPRAGDGTQQGDGAGSAGSRLVQSSTVVLGTGPQTVVLPAPTSAGTLLVATLGVNNLSGVSGPSGWQINANISVSGGCTSAMATERSGTAGRQSFAFTAPAGAPVSVQITEWSGLVLGTPIDAAGVSAGMNPTSALTVSTLMPPTTAGDLAIATFCEDTTMPTFTAGSGWMLLGQGATTASSPSLVSEVQANVPASTITATATSSLATKYAGTILTFHVM